MKLTENSRNTRSIYSPPLKSLEKIKKEYILKKNLINIANKQAVFVKTMKQMPTDSIESVFSPQMGKFFNNSTNFLIFK